VAFLSDSACGAEQFPFESSFLSYITGGFSCDLCLFSSSSLKALLLLLFEMHQPLALCITFIGSWVSPWEQTATPGVYLGSWLGS
jgi:hypothetical protein